jgi:hypothetical protein
LGLEIALARDDDCTRFGGSDFDFLRGEAIKN